MTIRKPITLGIIVGLLALAFTALPAMAQAAPTLRSGGKVVAKGTKILGTSSTLKTETPEGTLTCEKVTLEGEVTENPGAKAAGNGSATGCFVGGTVPVTITEIVFNISVAAGGAASGNATFVFDLPGSPVTRCHLSGAFTGTWTNGSDVVVIKPSTLTGKKLEGPGTCPASGKLSGEVTLETTTGSPVTVNNE